MFCKVCYDSKKPDFIFTSHNVRDVNRRLVCPTLLSTRCHFCKGKGHTTSYCKKRPEYAMQRSMRLKRKQNTYFPPNQVKRVKKYVSEEVKHVSAAEFTTKSSSDEEDIKRVRSKSWADIMEEEDEIMNEIGVSI